jgi:hypothetical protein
MTFDDVSCYDKGNPPEGGSAIIRGDPNICIIRLDGTSIRNYTAFKENFFDKAVFEAKKIVVLPGYHEVEFRYTTDGYYLSPVLWLKAKANHSYLAKSLRVSYSAFFWIEDSEMGTVVSGIKGGPGSEECGKHIKAMKAMVAEKEKAHSGIRKTEKKFNEK